MTVPISSQRPPVTMKIISGTAHAALAQEIADCLDTQLIDAHISPFPNGETFVKINENVRDEDIFIIQPTCPPTNHNLMEMLIITDALKRASAERITAVMPFFGYARQDRKDQPRVPITAKLVANLISAAGVDRVVTMDLHAAQIQGFFDIPVDHLFAKPVFVRHLREKHPEGFGKFTVVSPDVGGVKTARAYADALGADLAIVAKHRVSATKVEAAYLIGEVKDRHCLLIDDMTETGGTLCAAADILAENGAKTIYAGVSHAVLNDESIDKIEKSRISEVLTTNTTPVKNAGKVTVLSIAPLIAESIHRVHVGKSVSSLFEV